jgi:methionyl-tRNA synthetase
VRRSGTDSVRWWLLREVPRVGDADFTVGRLVARANADLAGGLGNLVSRTVAMLHRYRGGVVPGGGNGAAADPGDGPLLAACERAPALVGAALDGFDFRAAADITWDIVDRANRYIEQSSPWQLAREQGANPAAAIRLDAVLALLIHACRALATQLAPFVPAIAARIAAQCTTAGPACRLPDSEPVFPRIEAA